MLVTRMQIVVLFSVLLLSSFIAVPAQSGRPIPAPTPPVENTEPTPDDETERVFAEEIKINFSAFDMNGKFFPGLEKDDIVIVEDGILHQPASIRRVPASVLIVLDTGGEDRQAKSISTTRETAKALIRNLHPDDSVALLEYHDTARILTEWTTDRSQLLTALNKNLNFGRRSRFVEAMNLAVKFFDRSEAENRHMVLISDGLDSTSSSAERNAALRKLLSTDINVHVVSYTRLEQTIVAQRMKSVRGGGTRRRDLPPGADIPVQGRTPDYPIMTINLDREMMRKIKERAENLAQSEQALTELSEDANGEIFLPETKEEMIDKMGILAQNIDSQYVATYMPKRPLTDAKGGEVRSIQVSSRRSGVDILGRRKLVVPNGRP